MKRYVYKYLILISSSIMLFTSCEGPDTGIKNTSMRLYGGKSNDISYSVLQTSEGGYITVGVTGSYGEGNGDVWLVRTYITGDTIWTKTFGGSGYDAGYFIERTTEGDYIIVGETETYGAGDSDIWLLKVDAAGEIIWSKTYGGIGWDSGLSVQQTSDSGYIIVGKTASYGAGSDDIWLVKTDALGDSVWTKTFGGTADDLGYSVTQATNGEYVIVGVTESYGAGATDIWLIKTDASGDTVWTRTFGGIANDVGYSIQETSDMGYIICGVTESYGAGGADLWIIKTDISGGTELTNTAGGTGYDFGNSVQQTSDNGYIIAGSTQSYSVSGLDVWLYKFDESLNEEGGVSYGGGGDDYGTFVRQNSDGGYIITGYTNSYGAGYYDAFLIKTDENGNPVFSI